MSATLKQLREQVILKTGIQGNPKFPPTWLNQKINLAQRYVQTELNGLGMKKWESSITIGTPSAATYAGVSIKKVATSVLTNMLESPNSIMQIETTDSTTAGVAREVSVDDFEEIISNSYTAPTLAKPAFMRLANSVWLSPATITSGTAYYYKVVTDLTADDGVTEIPMEFEEFIVKRVALDVDEDNNKLQDKETALKQLSGEINSAYDKFLGKQRETFRTKEREKVKLS